jgi:hypothetical protein
MFRGQIWLLLALSLGLGACTGAPTGHTPSGSRPSASATVVVSADPQRCARLAKKGFTPCPPTPDRLQLPPTMIKNATNGAVSDSTSRGWGRSFQVAQAYYYWAMQHGARSALTSGGLSDPSVQAVGNLYGGDLKDLDAATAAGGTLIYEPPTIAITQVVPIPNELQDAMRRQGLVPAPYGLAVRFTGPTRRSIKGPDGKETEILSKDSSAIADGLIWGEERMDLDFGQIWYEFGNYGCQGEVRNVCQL